MFEVKVKMDNLIYPKCDFDLCSLRLQTLLYRSELQVLSRFLGTKQTLLITITKEM